VNAKFKNKLGADFKEELEEDLKKDFHNRARCAGLCLG
jgi:hypothetical protein